MRLGVLCLAFLLLGGCAAPADEAIRIGQVPAHAPSTTGDGPLTLRVEVREAIDPGRPIVGAAVVAYEERTPQRLVGGQVLEQRGTDLWARTDPQGVATFRVDPGTYSIVAEAPGRTREWRLAQHVTQAADPQRLVVGLFPNSVAFSCTGTVGAMAHHGPAGAAYWLRATIPMSGRPSDAFAQRLSGLQAQISWTDAAPAFGQLRFGIANHTISQWASPAGNAPTSGSLSIAETQIPQRLRTGTSFEIGPSFDFIEAAPYALEFQIEGTLSLKSRPGSMAQPHVEQPTRTAPSASIEAGGIGCRSAPV